MFFGYMRISKSDGSQSLDLQKDALIKEGVDPKYIYEDKASGKNNEREGLNNVLRAMREGDTLFVWKIDRLGRSLSHLVSIIQDLTTRGIYLKVLSGHGTAIDTTTASR
ncbi:MAG: DNA-invertase hin [Holosporales bacterium]